MIINSCSGTKKQKKNIKYHGQVYGCLLKKSYDFMEKNPNFLNEVRQYILSMGKDISPYVTDTFLVDHPILLNTKQDKAFVFMFNRQLDAKNSRVEYIRLICCSKKSGAWQFKHKKGFTFTFSYFNENSPSKSDQEILIRATGNMVGYGYLLDSDNCLPDDLFFEESGQWFTSP
jgi:hypothetical protein